MARIAGIDLPPQKRLWVGLTAIYGIGQERARKLANQAGVDFNKKIRDLTEDETNRLRQEIEKEGRVEGDLRKEIQMNIRRLIEIQAYRGVRHRRNLPVRGQRTHTNARTRKGPRKGAGAAKKIAARKEGPVGHLRFEKAGDLGERRAWQKTRRTQRQRQAEHPQQRQRRLPSVKKNFVRSGRSAWCRMVSCAYRRRLTTRSSH